MASIKKGTLQVGRFTISSIEQPEIPDESTRAVSRHSTHKLHEPEQVKKDQSRQFKYVEKADSDRSFEYDPKHDPFHAARPKLVNSTLIDVNALKHEDKATMTVEEVQPREQSFPSKAQGPTLGVLDLCFAFQSTLGAKFTEMLQVHKEVMLELMSKERSRDDQFRRLTNELSELYMQNARLQMENRQLCEKMGKQKE